MTFAQRQSLADAAPAVTVIVLCYNQAQYVVECLESIRCQTFTNWELVIVDDCSHDDSAAIIHQWLAAHPEVPASFDANTENQGICRNLNRVLTRTRGRFVAEIAADDRWESTKLADQVPLLERLSSDVALVYSDAYLMDVDGRQLSQRYLELHGLRSGPSGWVFDELLAGNFVAPMTMLVRRQALVDVGFYDESLFFEDWDMVLRLARRFRVAYSPIVSAHYRISPASTWRNPDHQHKILASTASMYAKWLGSTEGESQDLVKAKVYEAARQLQEVDPSSSVPYYRALMGSRPSLRVGVAWATAVTRFPERRLRVLGSRMKRALRKLVTGYPS